MKSSNKGGFLIILVLGFILLICFAPVILRLQIVVPPGWEIYDQICGLEHQGQLYTESSDFTSPNEVKGVYWKVDLDDPRYGVPTMQIVIGDLFHVDFAGRPTAGDKPADTIFVTRGNYSWYLDLHIYKFTVTMRTIADKNIYKTIHVPFQDLAVIEHETSWSHECWDGGSDWGYDERVGTRFDGGVYEKFVISPWEGFTYREAPVSSDPADPYVLDDCWAGVMNAYVLDLEMGQIENQWGDMPEPEADYWVKAPIPEGNQVPMFRDDGTFGNPAPAITWGSSVTPDTRIESTVALYTPVEMMAGAEYKLGPLFEVDDIYPCDVYVMYTVRVDVLTSHGFVLQSAIEPPEPQPPSDFISWAADFWTMLLGGLNPFSIFGPFAPFVAWLALFAVFGIIIVVLLLVFAPWLLIRLFGGAKQVSGALKEKRK